MPEIDRLGVFGSVYFCKTLSASAVCPPPPQTSVGQVCRVDMSSKVEVVWADNSMTVVLPQVFLPGLRFAMLHLGLGAARAAPQGLC